MVRLFHAYFPTRTLLLAALEAVVTLLGFILARILWLQSTDTEESYLKIVLVGCVLILCMYYYDLYESRILANVTAVLARLVQVLGTACVILSIVYIAYPKLQMNQGVLLIGILSASIGLLSCRGVFLAIIRSHRMALRTVLLGNSRLAQQLAAEVAVRPDLGIRLDGYIAGSPAEVDCESKVELLGTVETLPQIVERQSIECMIVALDKRDQLPMETLFALKKRGVRIEDGTDFYEHMTGKVLLESLNWNQLVFSPTYLPSAFTVFAKRAISIVASAVALVVLGPLMAAIAFIVEIDSKGPAIFRQQRIGKDGKLFTLFKFRSMRLGVDSDGIARPVQEKDERLTSFGGLLRKSRLDELPQLVNILLGDIDFVGPRPFVPCQEEEMASKIPFYSHRWDVRPGLTGWAQVNRGYCATIEDNAEKLSYDLYYIKNMSLGLDLLIWFKTVKTMILGRGAR